jgi:hypothetical protein
VIEAVTPGWLSAVAGQVPGDPGIDDFGPLFAACARVHASALDTDVYRSDHLKAASAWQTLVRLPCLEHSQLRWAWAVTAAMLIQAGHNLEYDPKQAGQASSDAATGSLGVEDLAALLRSWTVPSAPHSGL